MILAVLQILASAAFLELGPANTGPFGRIPVAHELTDERAAFTNDAETAEAVAFAQLPRPHLLHSWKALGVTVLKRVTCEVSPSRFCRACGFLAVSEGADGLYLADAVPPSHASALAAARRDRALLSRLDALAERIARSEDPALAIEARRVRFFLGTVGLEWEDLETLRLECLAWKDRLELLLGEEPSPHAVFAAPEPLDNIPRLPPPDGVRCLRLDGGRAAGDRLAFSSDNRGFSLVYTATNGTPHGSLDVTLHVADGHGGFLPYRYYCDLEPITTGAPRAPARGRGGFLFGTDERFRPYSFAYAAANSRIRAFPRLADYGPDYPDLHPSFDFKAAGTNGWTARLSVSWASLYGRWPMTDEKFSDVWYASVGGSAVPASESLALRWPRGRATTFRSFAAALSSGEITTLYKEELRRTETAYAVSYEERTYPFAKPPRPTFQRGECAADALFLERMLRPLLDRNANAWDAVRSDKDHKPTLDRLPEASKRQVWKNLGRLLYLSDEVSRLRADYLKARFAGREPPPCAKRTDSRTSPDAPDAGYDEDALSLDDKEF